MDDLSCSLAGTPVCAVDSCHCHLPLQATDHWPVVHDEHCCFSVEQLFGLEDLGSLAGNTAGLSVGRLERRSQMHFCTKKRKFILMLQKDDAFWVNNFCQILIIY